MSKKYLFFSSILVSGLLLGCNQVENSESSSDGNKTVSSEQRYNSGTYSAETKGYNGLVQVEVSFSENEIESIDVTKSSETDHLSEVVYDEVPKSILENQNTNRERDIVTGATFTSDALIQSVKKAVEEAGGNVELFESGNFEKSNDVEEIETDVVIIGAGSAGLTSAMSAVENGYDVVVIEKNGVLGGHTALSEGWFIAGNSMIQKELGETNDSTESIFKDIMENGKGDSNPDDLQLYVDNMGESIDWFLDSVDLDLPNELSSMSENKHDRVIIPIDKGAGVISSIYSEIKDDVDIFRETKATDLLMDGVTVIGVEALAKNGKTYQIKADATVLATGSYGANKELLPDELSSYLYYGANLAQGDGLILGQDVGADSVNLGYVEAFTDGVEKTPGKAVLSIYSMNAALQSTGILVDRNGDRVVNEQAPGPEIVAAQDKQEDNTLFIFTDETGFNEYYNNTAASGIQKENIDEWLEENNSEPPYFAHGDSIEEVANIIGIDPDQLQETKEKYNEFVENGEDKDFSRDPKYMSKPISDDGPYYLIGITTRYATTLGGLQINDQMQIVNTEGYPIDGLYGVGDVVGGVRGSDSIPGSDVGWAITSGYVFGENYNN